MCTYSSIGSKYWSFYSDVSKDRIRNLINPEPHPYQNVLYVRYPTDRWYVAKQVLESAVGTVMTKNEAFFLKMY